MFIKKIFENKIDDAVHRQFIRFGKGNYGMRAVLNVSKQAGKFKVSSSYELANDFIEFVCDIANSLKVSGIILSKQPMNMEGRKKAGLYEYQIEKEIKTEELKKIVYESYATLLDIESEGIKVKMKKKLPKPGKSGELKVNDKFCVLEFDEKFWPKFYNEFLFDFPREFKKARVEHTYVINEIILPKEEKDFEKMRILAKRKGKIIRKIKIDGKEITREKEIVV